MKNLWHDRKGMVTVLVTLLLIPSILVSGTAVDIARIYAARSIVQDANQLAANAALSEYNALLQDLYGLYGVMEDDPTLANLLDRYIKVSVFGQDSREQGLGTFQLFYGSDLSGGKVTAAPGQNLGNGDVLRRQIEEYAKLRAPVILTVRLLDRLEAFKNVKKDSEIIKKKMDLDEDIEDVNGKYQELYDMIQKINGYDGAQKLMVRNINDALDDIKADLKTLNDMRMQWGDAFDSGDEDAMAEYEAHYQAIEENIAARVTGGQVGVSWYGGTYNDDGEWELGYWNDWETVVGLEETVKDAQQSLDRQLSGLEDLQKLCEKIGKAQDEIPGKVEDLRSSLEKDGSKGLQASLTEPVRDADGKVIQKSTMDSYNDLFRYDVKAMGDAVKEYNTVQINALKKTLENVVLQSASGDVHIGMDGLKRLKDNVEGFGIDYIAHSRVGTYESDRLGPLANMTVYHYTIDTEFKAFQDRQAFASTKNAEFYAELERMCNNSSAKVKKKNADKALKQIFAEARKLWDGLTDYTPEGAWKYKPGEGSDETGSGDEDDLLTKDQWDKKSAKNALNSSLVEKLANLGDSVANYALLLTYDTEMFSDWTTPQKAEEDRMTMTGQTLSKENNYFYQSELEYLFAGKNNAQANLATVSGMILIVRFVFNYISAFQVTEVNNIVSAVRDACMWLTPPVALVIGEGVRMAFALGESALDLSRLRSGHQVALYKTNQTWKFSVSGIVEIIEGTAESVALNAAQANSAGDDSDAQAGQSFLDDTELKNLPMNYEDYVRVFLLFVGDTTLANRTRRLIELNVTHVKHNIGSAGNHMAIENKMAQTELVDLSKAMTGFSITTTVDLRMLFLSMPMARKGVDGVIPPGQVPISVTDHRGY